MSNPRKPCAGCGAEKRPGPGQRYCETCYIATRARTVPYVPRQIEGPCNPRTKMLNKWGYARVWTGTGDEPRRMRYVHVAAWEAVNGPLPDGMCLDHLCFEPSCSNLDHLELVTRSENSRRQQKAMRTHCLKGGHLLAGDNLGSGPWRRCMQCARDRNFEIKESRDAA